MLLIVKKDITTLFTDTKKDSDHYEEERQVEAKRPDDSLKLCVH